LHCRKWLRAASQQKPSIFIHCLLLAGNKLAPKRRGNATSLAPFGSTFCAWPCLTLLSLSLSSSNSSSALALASVLVSTSSSTSLANWQPQALAASPRPTSICSPPLCFPLSRAPFELPTNDANFSSSATPTRARSEVLDGCRRASAVERLCLAPHRAAAESLWTGNRKRRGGRKSVGKETAKHLVSRAPLEGARLASAS